MGPISSSLFLGTAVYNIVNVFGKTCFFRLSIYTHWRVYLASDV